MILNIVLGTLICVGLAVLLDKFVPLKLNPIISVVLWLVILFLGYSLYKSVQYTTILDFMIQSVSFCTIHY